MKQAYKIFLFLNLALLLVCSVATAGETKQYNKDPIIKFFKMGQSEMTTIAPTNALGREINQLYALLTWIGVGIMAIVGILFFVIIFRFREKRHTKITHLKEKTSNILEILWTVIPVLILVIIAIPTVKLIFKIEKFPDFADKKAIHYTFGTEADQTYNRYLRVAVVGHQWWWEFEYLGWHILENGAEKFIPINKVAANEARFPVNVPILFEVNSEDVIHSFWAPRLAGKIDANPGITNYLSFVFEESGYFWGQCAEYCGASHALMRLNMVGVSDTEFQNWLNWGKGQPITKTASAKRGKELMSSCVACHTMNGINDFVPRKEKYETALADFEVQNAEYQKALKIWKETPHEDGEGHFEKYKTKPIAPKVPKIYKGYLKTVAPDLTDIALRRRIISGVKENNKEHLNEWIQNPPKVKPEIKNTVVPRMPVYENIYTKEQIADIVEFLLTVEYSGSPNSNALKIK